MKVDVIDQNSKKVDEIDLPEEIFMVRWNPDLVHQVLSAQLANRRDKLAHAKGRGEVRGGGKKPWRQKGTGRARHGSIRSPLWKGGGVTFGPTKEREFSKKINKKMRKLAVSSVLSRKLREGEIKVLDNLSIQELKTKNFVAVLKNILGLRLSALVIPASKNAKVKRALGNVSKVDALSPYSLNVYDLLKRKNIILERDAIKEIEKHYTKFS